jgi:hypothetical protein
MEAAMLTLNRTTVPLGLALLMAVGMSYLVFPRNASAQGCMPIRFISPVVGGQGDVYLQRHTWQVGVAYRHLTSDQHIVGTQVRNDLGPGGQASFIENSSIAFSVAFAPSDRLSLALNVPFAQGSESRIYPDSKRHQTTAAGLGDVNLIATYWLRNTGLQPRGNLAVGLGIKAPTGSYHAEGYFWDKTGASVRFPVGIPIQLGDGGWGLILQIQGFQPIFPRSYVYAASSYTANPRKVTDVVRSPGSPIHFGVPDTYSARLGVATSLGPGQGISLSLGARVDATTKRDFLGGGAHEGFRRPGTVGYLDPGLSVTRGSRTFALSIPVRAYKNYRPSYVDLALGSAGGGGLARYLILASFSQRVGGR